MSSFSVRLFSKTLMPVTLSAANHAHVACYAGRDEFRRGMRVIARTGRGLEVGEVLMRSRCASP